MDFSTLGFIDVETTGHDPIAQIRVEGKTLIQPWHEIIDLACVFVRTPEFEIAGEFSTLVKPEHPEHHDLKTTPITNFPNRWRGGEWNDAPSLDSAIKGLFQACRMYAGEKAVVVPGGQNFFFDWSFLSTAFALLGIENDEHAKYIHYKRIDVASMAIQELWDPRTPLDMSKFSLRSGLLQETLGIEPEPKPHYAINGALQAYWTFKKLSERKLIRFEAA